MFAPDQLFSIMQEIFILLMCKKSELIAVMEKHATVVFDKGSIVWGLEENCFKQV